MDRGGGRMLRRVASWSFVHVIRDTLSRLRHFCVPLGSLGFFWYVPP